MGIPEQESDLFPDSGSAARRSLFLLSDEQIGRPRNKSEACHPGASAHQVELEVTDVLEKNIRTMGNIDNIESYSYNDLSLIQIELLSTVPDDDVEQCWDMLRRKVSDARALLPEGATTPIVKDDFGNVYGMFYALTGDCPTVNCPTMPNW